MANQSIAEKFQENLLHYSQTESIEERQSIEESLGAIMARNMLFLCWICPAFPCLRVNTELFTIFRWYDACN